MTQSQTLRADQVLATLQDVLQSSDSDTARIAAAKILLERLAPQSDEEQKHEAAERDYALAEARGMLAEFAAFKLASLRDAREMDQSGATATTDATHYN